MFLNPAALVILRSIFVAIKNEVKACFLTDIHWKDLNPNAIRTLKECIASFILKTISVRFYRFLIHGSVDCVYTQDPPSLTLKHYGKLLTFHPEKIADWLFREVNETCERRGKIQPSTDSAKQPTLIEILKLLPKTNCRRCNEPTRMVFATKVVEGVKNERDCPERIADNKKKLEMYLSNFRFE